MNKAHLAVICLIYSIIPGHSNIILAPIDTEALVGTQTHFNCTLSTESAEPPYWYHYNVGAKSHQRNTVYAYAKFYPPYRDRFRLENDTSTGIYILIIESVQEQDAGRYECHDLKLSANKSSSELIVIDSSPRCGSNIHPDGIIGPNSCGLEPETLELSCTVSFHGNKPPVLVWKKSGDERPITAGLTNGTLHRSVAYNLTITANIEMQGSHFSCHTTRSTITQHSCRTDIIKVTYVISDNSTVQKVIGDNVTCYANGSQSLRCNYTWKRATNEHGFEVINGQALTSTSTGRYICEANCSIRDQYCTVKAMEVYLRPTSNQSNGFRDTVIIASIVLVVVLVVVFVVIGIILLIRKQNKKLYRHVLTFCRGLISTDRPTSEEPQEEYPLQGEENYGLHVSKFKHKMKTKASSRDGKEISGVTTLKGELFVLTCGSRDVEVFCLESFKRRPTLELMGDQFGDITSCSQKERLFIMNWTAMERPNEIITVDARGKNNLSWPIKDNGGCLSITNTSNVLLTVYWKNILIEYSSEGAEVRQIRLHPDVIHPRHAMQLNANNFVVCYGDTADQLHRVSIVDADGAILKSSTSIPSPMNCPFYLAVNKTGMIFVCEAKNGRVTVLSHDLQYLTEIRPDKDQPGELRHPTRMTLDETNGLLIVADNEDLKNGQVTIFDLPWLTEVTVSS